MLGRLVTDAERKPHLFMWNGPIAPERLDAWAAAQGWVIPPDLRAFWCTTGGGEMFETETLLGPLDDPMAGNAAHLTETDVVGRNRWYREMGLAQTLLVFHEGLGTSCVDLDSHRYLVIEEEPPFRPLSIFDTLGQWYEGWIRAEYAERYGLRR